MKDGPAFLKIMAMAGILFLLAVLVVSIWLDLSGPVVRAGFTSTPTTVPPLDPFDSPLILTPRAYLPLVSKGGGQ